VDTRRPRCVPSEGVAWGDNLISVPRFGHTVSARCGSRDGLLWFSCCIWLLAACGPCHGALIVQRWTPMHWGYDPPERLLTFLLKRQTPLFGFWSRKVTGLKPCGTSADGNLDPAQVLGPSVISRPIYVLDSFGNVCDIVISLLELIRYLQRNAWLWHNDDFCFSFQQKLWPMPL